MRGWWALTAVLALSGSGSPTCGWVVVSNNVKFDNITRFPHVWVGGGQDYNCNLERVSKGFPHVVVGGEYHFRN